MSYCRWSNTCEVYAYHTERGFQVDSPEGCDLETSAKGFEIRLRELRAAGVMVPAYAIDKIQREISEGIWGEDGSAMQPAKDYMASGEIVGSL